MARHGHRYTPEYQAWGNLKTRCYNPNYDRYDDWGGRGITVCDRWKHSFENFLADMGKRPSPSHSVERLDNDKPYSPDNCVWATTISQCRNKRNNINVTFMGLTMCLAEWAEWSGQKYRILHRRYTLGWAAEDLLLAPVRSYTINPGGATK